MNVVLLTHSDWWRCGDHLELDTLTLDTTTSSVSSLTSRCNPSLDWAQLVMKTESGNIVSNPRLPTVIHDPSRHPSLSLTFTFTVHVLLGITFTHKSCFMSNENSL